MRKIAFVYVFCLLAILASWAQATEGEWQRVSNPYYIGQIEEIAVGYYNSARYIFAADSSAQGTLLKTTDDGASWAIVHHEPGFSHPRVVIQESAFQFGWTLMNPIGSDPDNDAGPYRSTDQGDSWNQKVDANLTARKLYALATVQSSTDLEVALVGGLSVQANQHYEMLFRTTDGGQSWALSQDGIPDNVFGVVWDICVYQDNPDYMYCAYQSGPASTASGIYRTTDGGGYWEQVVEFDPNDDYADPYAVGIDPNNPDHLFVVERAGDQSHAFFIDNATADPPDTPVDLGSFGPSKCIKFDNSGNAYFAFYEAHPSSGFHWVGRYDVSQPNWTFLPPTGLSPIGDKRAFSVAIDPTDDDAIFVGGSLMFYISKDGGDAFDEMVDDAHATGLSRFDVELSSASAPTFCAYTDMGFYRSTDSHTQKWIFRDYGGLPSGGVVRDRDTNGRWITGVYDPNEDGGSLMRSIDDGEHWANYPEWVGYWKPINCLLSDHSSSRVYAAGEGGLTGYSIFHLSTDDGYSWTHVSMGQSSQIRGIDLRPATSTVVIADYAAGIYRSLSNGTGGTWVPINSGLSNTHATRIKYCQGQPNIALAGTAAGVFKAADMSEATPGWVSASDGIVASTVVDLEFNPANYGIAYLSVNDNGVGRTYLTADTGRTWIAMSTGLGSELIYDFAVDPEYADTFYAATDDGLYKLKNPVKWGTVASSQTWGPGTIIINGDVTVPTGVTLTLAAGTTLLFVHDFDRVRGGVSNTKTEIIVSGTLNAQGTSNSPIVFNSYHSSQPTNGHWYGIKCNSGSTANLSYCQINKANVGLHIVGTADCSVSNCLFEGNSLAGIEVEGASYGYADISNCTIQNSETYGVYNKVGAFAATGLVISGCPYGIYCDGEDIIEIAECDIEGPSGTSYYGILVNGYEQYRPEVHIDQCEISGFAQGGIYLDGIAEYSAVTDIRLADNTIYDIYMSDCESEVPIVTDSWEANFVLGATYGLWVDYAASAYMRRTKFQNIAVNCAYVVEGGFADFGRDETGEHGENAFYLPEEAEYYIVNENFERVQGQYNYWDENCSNYVDNVDCSNPLQTDPLPNPRREVPGIRPTLASDFDLVEAYPNPFNPTATIQFNLTSPREVDVDIYNMLGQKVKSLYSGQAQGGTTSMVWDGTNELGEKVAAGLYLCQLRTASSHTSIKLTVLK